MKDVIAGLIIANVGWLIMWMNSGYQTEILQLQQETQVANRLLSISDAEIERLEGILETCQGIRYEPRPITVEN